MGGRAIPSSAKRIEQCIRFIYRCTSESCSFGIRPQTIDTLALCYVAAAALVPPPSIFVRSTFDLSFSGAWRESRRTAVGAGQWLRLGSVRVPEYFGRERVAGRGARGVRDARVCTPSECTARILAQSA